jgi:hypothetical protein
MSDDGRTLQSSFTSLHTSLTTARALRRKPRHLRKPASKGERTYRERISFDRSSGSLGVRGRRLEVTIGHLVLPRRSIVLARGRLIALTASGSEVHRPDTYDPSNVIYSTGGRLPTSPRTRTAARAWTRRSKTTRARATREGYATDGDRHRSLRLRGKRDEAAAVEAVAAAGRLPWRAGPSTAERSHGALTLRSSSETVEPSNPDSPTGRHRHSYQVGSDPTSRRRRRARVGSRSYAYK